MPGETTPPDGVQALEASIAKQVQDGTGIACDVTWRVDPAIVPSLDVRIARRRGGFDIFVPDSKRDSGPMQIVIRRLPCVVAQMQMAGPDVDPVMFHLSDGQLPSQAQCSFSSFDPSMTLVPDAYFYRDRGYQEIREFSAARDIAWADRDNTLVWRGRLSGTGLFTLDRGKRDNPLVRQRLRMAMHAHGSDIDFRFVSSLTLLEEHKLREGGFMAERIPTRQWIEKKFAIDIDGFSTTWDNLFHRFLMGNCVLKVDSQMGFRQWYYHHLKPYEHYVPVRSDLADLHDKVAWLHAHDSQARDIAAAGQALARSLTWESEMQGAGARLRALSVRSA